jgi:hypothetical protein
MIKKLKNYDYVSKLA